MQKTTKKKGRKIKMRNPKQADTIIHDCVPQHGPCPNNCNQCYYNICFYAGHKPLIPEPRDVAGGIVRMNSGHDSNLQKDLVLEIAKLYKHVFFNTSIPDLDFPGPVVLTLNPREEEEDMITPMKLSANLDNLMFVRLRTSPSNLQAVLRCARVWSNHSIAAVLTLMRYKEELPDGFECFYHRRLSISHEWYVANKRFWKAIYSHKTYQAERLIHTCGSAFSKLCGSCRLCEYYYGITIKRLMEKV